MAGLVRQPGGPGDVTDGIDAIHPGAAVFIGDHMSAVDLHAGLFQSQILDISDDADGGNHRIEFHFFNFSASLDMGGHLALGAVQLLDHGLLHDLHALLFELLLGEGADLGVFDGQHAVHDLDHGRVGPKRVVEAGEFDADRARADDQQFLRHPRRVQRVLVGPDQIAIRLEPRKFPRPCAGGQDDVLGADLFRALVGLDADLAFAGQPGLAHDDVDLVLFQQVLDPAFHLLGHAARPFDHRRQIIVDLVRAQAEFLGAVHQVEHLGRAQQRLGRDAAPVQADAAQVFAFHHRGLQPQLGGPNCGDVATGTGPDDKKIVGCGHGCSPLSGKIV